MDGIISFYDLIGSFIPRPCLSIIWDDKPNYIRKRDQGIQFYHQRPAHYNIWVDKRPLYHRRITSLRIHTHTVK